MKFVIALTIVFLTVATAYASDGFLISLFPDSRAPSLTIAGVNSFSVAPITLSVNWEAGIWAYIGEPPTGYGSVFYTFQVHPQAAFSLFSGWEFRVGGIVEYRTNLPDRVVFVPQLSIWHAW